ncbi:hypothetical protein ABPG75_003377 [Micractinium tetrahymenae]
MPASTPQALVLALRGLASQLLTSNSGDLADLSAGVKNLIHYCEPDAIASGPVDAAAIELADQVAELEQLRRTGQGAPGGDSSSAGLYSAWALRTLAAANALCCSGVVVGRLQLGRAQVARVAAACALLTGSDTRLLAMAAAAMAADPGGRRASSQRAAAFTADVLDAMQTLVQLVQVRGAAAELVGSAAPPPRLAAFLAAAADAVGAWGRWPAASEALASRLIACGGLVQLLHLVRGMRGQYGSLQPLLRKPNVVGAVLVALHDGRTAASLCDASAAAAEGWLLLSVASRVLTEQDWAEPEEDCLTLEQLLSVSAAGAGAAPLPRLLADIAAELPHGRPPAVPEFSFLDAHTTLAMLLGMLCHSLGQCAGAGATTSGGAEGALLAALPPLAASLRRCAAALDAAGSSRRPEHWLGSLVAAHAPDPAKNLSVAAYSCLRGLHDMLAGLHEFAGVPAAQLPAWAEATWAAVQLHPLAWRAAMAGLSCEAYVSGTPTIALSMFPSASAPHVARADRPASGHAQVSSGSAPAPEDAAAARLAAGAVLQLHRRLCRLVHAAAASGAERQAQAPPPWQRLLLGELLSDAFEAALQGLHQEELAAEQASRASNFGGSAPAAADAAQQRLLLAATHLAAVQALSAAGAYARQAGGCRQVAALASPGIPASSMHLLRSLHSIAAASRGSLVGQQLLEVLVPVLQDSFQTLAGAGPAFDAEDAQAAQFFGGLQTLHLVSELRLPRDTRETQVQMLAHSLVLMSRGGAPGLAALFAHLALLRLLRQAADARTTAQQFCLLIERLRSTLESLLEAAALSGGLPATAASPSVALSKAAQKLRARLDACGAAPAAAGADGGLPAARGRLAAFSSTVLLAAAELAAAMLRSKVFAGQQAEQQLALACAIAAHHPGCSSLRCPDWQEEEQRPRRCGGCRTLRFCSAACQQAAWQLEGHRRTCALLHPGAAAQAREALQSTYVINLPVIS